MARDRTVPVSVSSSVGFAASLLLFTTLIATVSCTGVPNPDTAPDNYLRFIGFEIGVNDRVLLRWRDDVMPLKVHLPLPPEGLFEDDALCSLLGTGGLSPRSYLFEHG